MRILGPVVCDPRTAYAKWLEGRRVLASESFVMLDLGAGAEYALYKVVDDSHRPFICSGPYGPVAVTFVREIIDLDQEDRRGAEEGD